jgi:ribosomal protein S18 acetylase RimI-like enzyme
MRYALRLATEADYDFLYALHEATMRPTVSQIWGWDDARQSALFRERFDPATRQVIVIDGRDVGVLEVEERPVEVFLANIEIAPEQQNRGLGAAIITDILHDAHARRLPVTLQVNRVNPARWLYERLGFVETGRTETHYLMRADAPAPGSRTRSQDSPCR